MKQSDCVSIKKMIFYCDQIDALMDRFGRDLDAFKRDFAYQYAVNMCILQIGELVNHLTPEALAENAQVPWRLIRAMRNTFAHDYERTKLSIVWHTMNEDIPILRRQLVAVLNATALMSEEKDKNVPG